MTETAVSPARRRHRRWPWVLLVVLVLLVLGTIYGGDAVARPIAQRYTAQRIGAALGVAPSELTVSFSSTPLPLQLLDGRIDSVDVTAPDLALGPLTGDAVVHAEGVPLDPAAPTDVLRIRFTIDRTHLSQLAAALGGGYVQSISLAAPDATADVRVPVLGIPLPVGVTFQPGVVDGRLAFTPTAVAFGGQTITIAQLKQNALLRPAAGVLAQQRTVCISDHLPKAVTVTGVQVVGQEVVVTARGDGAVLADLGTKGVCG